MTPIIIDWSTNDPGWSTHNIYGGHYVITIGVFVCVLEYAQHYKLLFLRLDLLLVYFYFQVYKISQVFMIFISSYF